MKEEWNKVVECNLTNVNNHQNIVNWLDQNIAIDKDFCLKMALSIRKQSALIDLWLKNHGL